MTRRLDESVTRRLDDSDTGPKEGRSPARPCSTHGATSTQIGRPCTHPRAILRGMGAVRLEPAGGGEGGEGRAAHNLSGFARILGPGGRPQSSAAARRRPPRAAGSLVVSPLGTARPCARAQHRSANPRACRICRRARALFAAARVPCRPSHQLDGWVQPCFQCAKQILSRIWYVLCRVHKNLDLNNIQSCRLMCRGCTCAGYH